MSDEGRVADQVETGDARIYLVNGLAFNVALPVDVLAYGNWLKIISADGFAVFGDLVIAVPAIACIVRGGLLHSMSAGMPVAMPAAGRMN